MTYASDGNIIYEVRCACGARLSLGGYSESDVTVTCADCACTVTVHLSPNVREYWRTVIPHAK